MTTQVGQNAAESGCGDRNTEGNVIFELATLYHDLSNYKEAK